MNCLKFFIMLMLGFIISSCAPTDPSVNDLKSPCVSAEFWEMGNFNVAPIPCVKRNPIGNQFV